jgi:hypothetical protein
MILERSLKSSLPSIHHGTRGLFVCAPSSLLPSSPSSPPLPRFCLFLFWLWLCISAGGEVLVTVSRVCPEAVTTIDVPVVTACCCCRRLAVEASTPSSGSCLTVPVVLLLSFATCTWAAAGESAGEDCSAAAAAVVSTLALLFCSASCPGVDLEAVVAAPLRKWSP